MMTCRKCGAEVPEAPYCCQCGTAQDIPEQRRKRRGNGQGSVYKLESGKYKAVVVLGYFIDDSGKAHRRTRSAVYEKKKDAVAALPELRKNPRAIEKTNLTFKALYDQWLPTHRAGKDTINCYKAAIKYFKSIWFLPIADIDVDDLQECIDDCPHGKRTRENMRAVVGLVYKFGIPRHVIPENLNLSPFLIVEGESAAARESFNDLDIERIRRAVGTVPYADAIYAMIYTGFRPSEFLALTSSSYDKAHRVLTGGAKTEAGKNRKVTVSPKILPIIERHAAEGGPLFASADGRAWTLRGFTDDAFYPALEAIGIDNPLVPIAGGKLRHKYTPHSCRHTFATLMKRVPGADRDKQELIGHASGEQLRYYQDSTLDDIRKITDAI